MFGGRGGAGAAQARDAERRADQDEALARSMADGIRKLVPRCAPEEAEAMCPYTNSTLVVVEWPSKLRDHHR